MPNLVIWKPGERVKTRCFLGGESKGNPRPATHFAYCKPKTFMKYEVRGPKREVRVRVRVKALTTHGEVCDS